VRPPFSKIVVLRRGSSARTSHFGEQLKFVPIPHKVAIDPGTNL
jgi:hypothetical protein